MSQSQHLAKAKSLTAKFKKVRKEMLRLSSPYDPWVVLQSPKQSGKCFNPNPASSSRGGCFGLLPQRDRSESVSTDTTDEETVSSAEEVLPANDPQLISELKELVVTSCKDGLSGGFYKLHELCGAQNPRIEMIRIFISTYPWVLKQRDLSGDTPLLVAIKRDDPSCLVIGELLKRYPESAQIRDKNGVLPLFCACRRPKLNIGVLKALVQAHPQAASMKCIGCYALHNLLHTGCATPENVKFLLSMFPDAIKERNNFGNLPLHYLCASDNPNLETVRIVMRAYPSGVTTRNKIGETPITRTLARRNDEEFRERVRLLLRASEPSALSFDQVELLHQLNWEARKLIILVCVHMAKKAAEATAAHAVAPTVHGRYAANVLVTHVSNGNSKAHEEEEEEDEEEGKYSQAFDNKGLMELYYTCDGVWRDIIAFL